MASFDSLNTASTRTASNLSPFLHFIGHAGRGVTGIFFWGGKVIFPDFFPGVKWFFPVKISHFGRSKTNFCRFQMWKKKKKKKREKEKHLFLELFLLPFQIFHLPFYNFHNFPSFLLNFHPFSLFFLASFFPIRQQKFPGQKSLGSTLPPAPCPLPVTPLHAGQLTVVYLSPLAWHSPLRWHHGWCHRISVSAPLILTIILDWYHCSNIILIKIYKGYLVSSFRRKIITMNLKCNNILAQSNWSFLQIW